MRAFISIDLPAEFNDYLVSLQKEIKNANLSFTKQFHITMKFFEDIDDKEKFEIIEELSQLKMPKFEASLGEIDYFAEGKEIKVIWIGVKPKESFNALCNEVNEKLVNLYDPDEFVPHITLARVKFMEDRNKFLDELKQIKVKDMTFTVDKFSLKKSTLTPKGAVYADLKVFNLE